MAPDNGAHINGSSSSSPLFLGLDLSTQQLKAVLTTLTGAVLHETAVNFDRDLPHYGTSNGALFGPGIGEVTSPVGMWVEAYDLLMERMKQQGWETGRIRGVSGSGQQHGSVYWSQSAKSLLSSLDASKSLKDNLVPAAFSIANSPIWQDSSTTKECRELNESVGGAQALADLTGSRAYERFTGTQILKIRKTKPEAYDATAHISLVSSFMPSLFLGSIAPIDASDASGMNLMNILSHTWDPSLLATCSKSSHTDELRAKLGPEPVEGGSFIGPVSRYWVERWGFSPKCKIAPFTGDNPATMASLSAVGDAVLSLGTSTTFLLNIPPSASGTAPKRFTTSHLLAHPAERQAYIAMLCYKNGALARQEIRDKYAGADWDRFNNFVDASPAGNNGYIGFTFPLLEIIPPNVQGMFLFRDGEEVTRIPDDAQPRAILESQFLSIKSRIQAILPEEDNVKLKRLILTGGSSLNKTFQQIAADIFGLPAYVSETKEAAAHGGAVLALFAYWKEQQKQEGDFNEMKDGLKEEMRLVAQPVAEKTKVYEGLVEKYRMCEEAVVKACAALRN